MAKPPMTSQPARRLWFARETLLDQRTKVYEKILRKHRAELVLLAGKNVRNILRVLNARHKFMSKSQRLKDMRLFRTRCGLRELLRRQLGTEGFV